MRVINQDARAAPAGACVAHAAPKIGAAGAGAATGSKQSAGAAEVLVTTMADLANQNARQGVRRDKGDGSSRCRPGNVETGALRGRCAVCVLIEGAHSGGVRGDVVDHLRHPDSQPFLLVSASPAHASFVPHSDRSPLCIHDQNATPV